jgi:tetratricopeptide (TPR) repeat protein
VSALSTISVQVANALKLALPDPNGPPQRDTGPDPVSYQRFLQSIGLLSTNKESDVTSGLALLKGVVRASPAFADGHALYGYASWRQYFAGWDGGLKALTHSRLQAKEALDLDETCAWARMTLIRVYWDLGQHEQAIAEGIRAVVDAPGHVGARLALARALNNAGMADLALPLTEGVLAVDPSNVTAQKLRVWNLLMVRRLADAVSRGTAYLRQHPEDSNTAWALTMAHSLLGDPEDAACVAERGLRADQANSSLWLLLGYVQLAAGDASSARRTWERGARSVLDRLGERSTNYRSLAYVANMHAALGQRDRALEMLQRIEQADPYNGYLNYRLAHVAAELGEVEQAVRLIESAADSGFLSVQMLRCEERVCALARLAGYERYSIAARRLEARVDKLRTHYGELLPAVIAPVEPAGGNGASSPLS